MGGLGRYIWAGGLKRPVLSSFGREGGGGGI